ncbi:MAG: DMT family transporter [Desulfobacterales bacterium]|nr:DMT family transporter [Desulfobacterales bacterium]
MVYLKLFLTAFFWGGTFIAGRSLAGTVGPFSAAFLRFAVAATLLILLTWRLEGRLPKLKPRMLPGVLLLGMTGVFSYNVFFFKGLALIEAGRAAIIIANNPVLITLFSALLFGERLTPLKIVGVLLSVTGAMVVIARGDLAGIVEGGIGPGELFIFGCVASWVAYSLIGKKVMADLSPLSAVAYSAVIGAAALLPTAIWEGLAADAPSYRILDWVAIFYLGVFGTVVGFVWYYQGIQRIGPARASLFINFVPISAVVLAFFLLGEALTPSLAAGTLLVCTGVYLTNRKARPPVPVPAPAAATEIRNTKSEIRNNTEFPK